MATYPFPPATAKRFTLRALTRAAAGKTAAKPPPSIRTYWLLDRDADALAAAFLEATDSGADATALNLQWQALPENARAIVEAIALELALARRRHRQKLPK